MKKDKDKIVYLNNGIESEMIDVKKSDPSIGEREDVREAYEILVEKRQAEHVEQIERNIDKRILEITTRSEQRRIRISEFNAKLQRNSRSIIND